MMSESFRDLTIGEILTVQAAVHGQRPYLHLGDELWTYGQAEDEATRLAAGLRQLGLRPGDRFAVLLPNVPAYVIALFGAAKAGLILVPINIRRHQNEIRLRLSKSRPSALLTFSDPQAFGGVDHLAIARQLQPDVPGLEHLIVWGNELEKGLTWEKLIASGAPEVETSAGPGDPAAVVHTLGSSGRPRGAVLSHGALIRNAAAVAESLASTPADIFLGAVPFSNAFGLTPTILACTLSMAQLACLPRYEPGQALATLDAAGVTIHHGVPTMFALELNHPDFKPGGYPQLRTGIMSGAPCPPELVRRVRQQMVPDLLLAYGLTEAGPSVTITRFNDGPVTATETVGRPHEGIELKVVDESGGSLPAGEEGELYLRGYNVMKGYWEDPESTDQVLDADGWLHTGDLATIDPDGPVRIVGRVDDVINRAGYTIYPGTVEMVLRAYPGVKDAAVVGVPDLIYGELSYACLVRLPGADFAAKDLLAYASGHLADYALPDRILFFDALPRRGSGPVRKDYLRERVRIRGRAWKFGRNIDTDAIIPARRCNTADPRELALFCMEDADPDFVNKMERGDLIVAGSNFGCGSSREVAPLSIKAAGVSAVIAKSFARIFFRNAINIGLPILECAEAVEGIQEGDEVEVEPTAGIVRNLTRNRMYQAEPFPDFLQRIIDRGGLLAYVEERLAKGNGVQSG